MQQFYVSCLYTDFQAKSIFKALGLMAEQKLHSAGFLEWLLSYSACQSYKIQWQYPAMLYGWQTRVHKLK